MASNTEVGQSGNSEQLTRDVRYMREALSLARIAAEAGEVPVGAIVISQDQIIGRGSNKTINSSDPTGHAEIIALREAAATLGNYRLTGCELFSTIEPCAMCAGAITHARISRLVFGAFDPKAGAAGSVIEVINHPKLNHKLEVVPGVLAAECAELMQRFFRSRR